MCTPPGGSRRPDVFAHRGLASTHAENTLEAFETALEAGATWLETDVNTTADGVVLAFHDPTLNRVAGRSGLVAAMTWAELRDIELTDGGKIPRLEDVLRTFPHSPFNIDVKDPGSVEAVIGVLKTVGGAERVRLASFSELRLRRVHARARSAGVQVRLSASQLTFTLFYAISRIHPGLWNFLSPIMRRLLLPFDAVQVPPYFTVAGRTIQIVDRKLMAAARAAGLQVHVWTVDDERTMRELISLGVDGIITNRTDLLTSVLAA